MAKYTGPVMKKCRALGINPQDLGISRKSSKQVKFRRRKQSDYALQFKEKTESQVRLRRARKAVQKLLREGVQDARRHG